MITKTDVEQIAWLACIELDEEDMQAFTIQFNAILEYFEELEDIEAEPIEEEERNMLRADEVTASLTQQELLQTHQESKTAISGARGYYEPPRAR